jgi:tetratricopeptide (TPR) repeat protein
VRHVDLLPTLADLVDFDIPERAEGVSLFESATDVGAFGESYYATLHYGWSPVWSWRDERWTYLESTKPRLFDRTTDPAERFDVADRHPEIVARLAARLAPWVREPAAGEPEMDAEARDKLAALGYLSGGATVRPNRTMDPIDEIDSIERLLRGMTLLGQGNPHAALPLLERAYAADSNNVSAVFSLADCLRLVGRPAAAARHYRRTLELNPQIAEAWAHLALLTLESGDVDESRRLFRAGLEENPRAFPLLMAAGDVSRASADWARAEELYDRARDAEPRRPEPLVGRAQLAEARGLAPEADSWWRRAHEADPNHPAIPAKFRSGTEK